MDTLEATAPRLRWLRAFVAGLLAELALMVPVVPIYMTMSQDQATALLNLIVPPISLAVFVVAGWWAARPVPSRGVMQGALAAIIAVGIYALMMIAALMFRPGAKLSDAMTTPYLVAHVLKIVGGAIGGWLVARKAQAPA
jgi:ABC-type proline/glycine betaine transport system permease subunit